MIYEHRICTVIMGKEDEFIARVNEYLPRFEKYGAKVIGGIFRTIIGDSNEISYMLGFDDLAHHQKVWKSMAEDEDLNKMREKWAKEEFPVHNIRSKILSSTEYSSSR